jgi:two-component system, NarL family, response regulator NreC
MSRHLHLAAAPSSAGPSTTPAIRVVVGDDHSLMRRNLRLLLEREDGLEVVAEAGDVPTAIRHVHGHRPHVAVLDLSAPDGSSLDTIRRLRQQVPDTQIIVLSMEDEPAFAQLAIEAGAVGYVLKDCADSDLPQAVRSAVRGQPYVSRRVGALLRAMRTSAKPDNLSPREVEVLRLIALGHTSAEIAAKLHLSARTVETHRSRIHRKLGLSARAELVRYALRRGLFGG